MADSHTQHGFKLIAANSIPSFPKEYALNVAVKPDGTISAVPEDMRSPKEGWWYTDGQIWWRLPPNDPVSNLEGDLGSPHMQGTPTAQGHEADNFNSGGAR